MAHGHWSPHMVEGDKTALWVVFDKGTNPIHEGRTSWPNHPPKAPPPNTITLRIRPQWIWRAYRHSVYNTFWLYDLARAINLTIFLITPKIVVTKLCLSLSTQRMTNMLYAGALSPICCWRWAFLMNHSTDTLSWLLGLSKEPQHSHCL